MINDQFNGQSVKTKDSRLRREKEVDSGREKDDEDKGELETEKRGNEQETVNRESMIGKIKGQG